MTLKKINKSNRNGKKKLNFKGQAIFEYFILTIVVVTVVLFFSSSEYFQNIRNSCLDAFNLAIEEMLE